MAPEGREENDVQDVVIQGKERSWMKSDTSTMPRQKLMRATLDALVDIAKTQDAATLAASKRLDAIDSRLDELDERYREISEGIKSTDLRLRAILTELLETREAEGMGLATPEMEIPEDGGGEPMLEVSDPEQQAEPVIPTLWHNTPGWEYANWRGSKNMTLTDQDVADRHPSTSEDEVLLSHWRLMDRARFKLWQLAHKLDLDSDKKGFNPRLARLLTDTATWRRVPAGRVQPAAVSAVRHAAVVWGYGPDEDGKAVPMPGLAYSAGYLTTFNAALDELLEE